MKDIVSIIILHLYNTYYEKFFYTILTKIFIKINFDELVVENVYQIDYSE